MGYWEYDEKSAILRDFWFLDFAKSKLGLSDFYCKYTAAVDKYSVNFTNDVIFIFCGEQGYVLHYAKKFNAKFMPLQIVLRNLLILPTYSITIQTLSAQNAYHSALCILRRHCNFLNRALPFIFHSCSYCVADYICSLRSHILSARIVYFR